MKLYHPVFEIRTFHLVGYFSGNAEEPSKQQLWVWSLEMQKSLFIKTTALGLVSGNAEEPLNQNNSFGFGGYCNICALSELCLFCNSNRMKFPFPDVFPDVFDELLFLYASSFSPESVSSSHHRTNTHNVGVLNSPNQISSKRILNAGQD